MSIPTGSASHDYYGVTRLGDNRYANSIVALKASTGRLVWAFQTVHHDIWDYDNSSPPALTTVTHEGRRLPVVVQANKSGMLFILDRTTGRPVFPIEERAVPSSAIPLEVASPTQPFTVGIAPQPPSRRCGGFGRRRYRVSLAEMAIASARLVSAWTATLGRSAP